VPETTTPSVDTTADNPTSENWEARYAGLQRVIAKRDESLHTATSELDALKAEKEALLTEVSDYRQSRVDADEEEKARIQYEALRERFEPAPPKPIGNNPARDWADPGNGSTRKDIALDTGW
jgi:hypothetical protein